MQWKRPPITGTSAGFKSRSGAQSAGSMMIMSMVPLGLAPLFLVPCASELEASDMSLWIPSLKLRNCHCLRHFVHEYDFHMFFLV